MSPEEIRDAMRALKRVPEANVDRAMRALIEGGAVDAIVGSHITQDGTLVFDGADEDVAWLHVGYIDVHRDYTPPGSFTPDAWPKSRRVAFPGHTERGRKGRRSPPSPPMCQGCFNPPEACECPGGPQSSKAAI